MQLVGSQGGVQSQLEVQLREEEAVAVAVHRLMSEALAGTDLQKHPDLQRLDPQDLVDQAAAAEAAGAPVFQELTVQQVASVECLFILRR